MHVHPGWMGGRGPGTLEVDVVHVLWGRRQDGPRRSHDRSIALAAVRARQIRAVQESARVPDRHPGQVVESGPVRGDDDPAGRERGGGDDEVVGPARSTGLAHGQEQWVCVRAMSMS